jgi:hypothetical protein
MVTLAESHVNERVGRFIDIFYNDSNVSTDYETRRGCSRYQFSDPVDVMIDSKETPTDIIMATGRDISKSGIGLYSHRPIPEGTEMIINIENGRDRLLAKAVAVHSTMSVGLFKVGARFIV